MKAATIAILLGAVLILAAVLRFTALDFGEGRVNVRPDEHTVPMTFVGMDTNVLMPPLVIYGGGYFYPLGVFTWAWEGAGLPTVAGPNLLPGADRIRIARWWSSALSLLTVLLTFLVGWRMGRAETALLASLIVATSTLAVREAHFAKADSATAFATVVFLLIAVDSIRRGTPRAVLMGLALGYAVSHKASVGLLLPAAYVFLRNFGDGPWKLRWRPLLIGVGVSAATVAVLNPHWITHTTDALLIARITVGQVSDHSWLAGSEAALPPLQYHAQISLRYGGGLLLAWMAIPVILYGSFRGPVTRLLSLSILGPLLIFASSPMVLARFLLPIIPPLALLVSIAVTDLLGSIGSRKRWAAFLAATLVLTAEPALRSWRMVELLSERDTRLLASDWIEENVPTDGVLVSWGTPVEINADWGGVPAGGRPVYRNLEPGRWKEKGIGHVVWHSYPSAYSSTPPPEELLDMSPIAVFEPFDGSLDQPVLEPMDAFYLPLARLDGIARPGPRIAIYEVAAANASH